MTHIAQCASLAEVSQLIDLVERQLIADRGIYVRQAALHPPSPQPN
jgi:hypothetical protein